MTGAAPPRVTVVVPAYEPGAFLLRALDSVRAQDRTDWHCVVLDDGGEEDLSWVDRYDHRVVRIRQRNAGVSVARNVAVDHARGDLIAYLDQDDEWLPGKLEAQVAALDAGERHFSWTAFRWEFASGDVSDGPVRPESYASFLADGHLCLSSLVVRREWLTRAGGFSPLLKVQQDYDLVLRLFAAGAEGVGVPEILTCYRLHDANVSQDYLAAFRERINVIHCHRNAALQRGDGDVLAAAHRGIARTRELYGGQAFAAFRTTRRPKHLARAARWNPGHTANSLMNYVRRR